MSAAGLSYLDGHSAATLMIWLIRVLCVTSVLVALLVIVASDLKQQIIPDRMVLAIACAGIALRLVSQPALIWISLIVAVLTLFITARLVAQNLIGGGDAKLIAAVTLLTNAGSVPLLLFQIVMAGGVVCLTSLAVHLAEPMMLAAKPGPFKKFGSAFQSIRLSLPARLREALNEPIPYSLAIALGLAFHAVNQMAVPYVQVLVRAS